MTQIKVHEEVFHNGQWVPKEEAEKLTAAAVAPLKRSAAEEKGKLLPPVRATVVKD